MTLDNDPSDEVVGMVCIKNKETDTVLVVSEQGYGKRSNVEDYRMTNRGGKGVKTINITDKTGKLVAIKNDQYYVVSVGHTYFDQAVVFTQCDRIYAILTRT